MVLTPKKCSLPHLPHYMAHLSIFPPYFLETPKNPTKKPPKGLKCLQKAIKPSKKATKGLKCLQKVKKPLFPPKIAKIPPKIAKIPKREEKE